jgi:hypothetical protein
MDVATAWNKEQAELLRRIAVARGSCDADQGQALDGSSEAGFSTVQTAGAWRLRMQDWRAFFVNCAPGGRRDRQHRTDAKASGATVG